MRSFHVNFINRVCLLDLLSSSLDGNWNAMLCRDLVVLDIFSECNYVMNNLIIVVNACKEERILISV